MSTESLSREEFLYRRRRGIGGSDVAAILGISPWKTPLDVYLDKIGESDPSEETEAMHWGNVLEPVVRREYELRTGAIVEEHGQLAHPEHPHILANVDGIADHGEGDLRVLEIKTSRVAAGWGEEGTDEIPDAYALQVQHYMLVTGLPCADVAVLIGGSDFRIYHIEADPDLHDLILTACLDFWGRVESRDPPEPMTYEEAARRFRDGGEGRVEASQEVAIAVEELRELRAQMKTLSDRESELKAEVAKAIGDLGDTLMYRGDVLATWRTPKPSQRFDTKAFAAAHPELHQQFLKQTQSSKRLLIK